MVSQPSVLDWMSGVVVPVMLGVFTLGVAAWAAVLARQANAINRSALEATARDRRAPYGAALWHKTAAMVSARQVGLDPLKQHLKDLEELQRVDALRIEAAEPSTPTVTLWASLTARRAEASSGEDFLQLAQRLSAMIHLWVVDPPAATRKIEADEWFVALRAAENVD